MGFQFTLLNERLRGLGGSDIAAVLARFFCDGRGVPGSASLALFGFLLLGQRAAMLAVVAPAIACGLAEQGANAKLSACADAAPYRLGRFRVIGLGALAPVVPSVKAISRGAVNVSSSPGSKAGNWPPPAAVEGARCGRGWA